MSEGEGVHHDGDVPPDAGDERRPLDERPERDDDARSEAEDAAETEGSGPTA